MKILFLLRILPIGLLFLLSGCDECGENVKIGDYLLMEEGFADWFPYESKSQLQFKNQNDQIITLDVLNVENKWVYTPIQHICDGGFGDSSEEYFNGQWIYYKYVGEFETVRYQLEISYYVELLDNTYSNIEQNLYDLISYSSLVVDDKSTNQGVGGYLNFVASYRSNAVNPDISSSSFVFADQLLINGSDYQNVWYFNRESPAGTFTPALYVKQGKGIVAFLGVNDEVWELQ